MPVGLLMYRTFSTKTLELVNSVQGPYRLLYQDHRTVTIQCNKRVEIVTLIEFLSKSPGAQRTTIFEKGVAEKRVSVRRCGLPIFVAGLVK